MYEQFEGSNCRIAVQRPACFGTVLGIMRSGAAILLHTLPHRPETCTQRPTHAWGHFIKFAPPCSLRCKTLCDDTCKARLRGPKKTGMCVGVLSLHWGTTHGMGADWPPRTTYCPVLPRLLQACRNTCLWTTLLHVTNIGLFGTRAPRLNPDAQCQGCDCAAAAGRLSRCVPRPHSNRGKADSGR